MFSSKNKAVKYLAFHTYQPHPIILYIPLYEYMWYLLFCGSHRDFYILSRMYLKNKDLLVNTNWKPYY